MRLRPYRTMDNHIDGVVLSFIDITQRRTAEAGLLKSEERYREMFERLYEAAIKLGADGTALKKSRTSIQSEMDAR